MRHWKRAVVSWRNVSRVGFGVAIALACRSSGSPSKLDEVPKPAPAREPEASPAPQTTVEPQARPAEHAAAPEADAPLVRRLHALATAWNEEGATQRINDSLAVHLAEDNGGWSGTSSRWPMVVAYHPKGADQRESLHVSFTTLPSLTLADLQAQFGPPAHQIKSKESLVDFNGPSGVRVVVGLLGGLSPESAVSWIRLEEPGRRKPPPKDLF